MAAAIRCLTRSVKKKRVQAFGFLPSSLAAAAAAACCCCKTSWSKSKHCRVDNRTGQGDSSRVHFSDTDGMELPRSIVTASLAHGQARQVHRVLASTTRDGWIVN
jgi:hypothetical protein